MLSQFIYFIVILNILIESLADYSLLAVFKLSPVERIKRRFSLNVVPGEDAWLPIRKP
jgi:hypothetical protein